MWPSTAYPTLPECIGLSLVSTVDDAVHTRVGVCLSGSNEGRTLVMTSVDPDDFTSTKTSVAETVYMFDKNPFGQSCGARCELSINSNNRSQLQASDIGLTTFGGKKPVVVSLNVLESATSDEPTRKKRTLLQRAEMPDGTQLTPRETMDALVTWLNEKNSKYAGKYGVSQLVWAEEQASSRSSTGGHVRGWFRHDVSDGGKRKVCPHASSAIEYMKEICDVDFYSDMKTNGSKYHSK